VAWLARTFEAVVLDWDAVVGSARRASRTALARRLPRLGALGIDVAVLTGRPLDDLEEFPAAPDGPGRLLLSAGGGATLHERLPGGTLRALAACAPAERRPFAQVFDALAAGGIGPGLVLVVAGHALRWRAEQARRCTVVLVGDEPALGTGDGLHLGGGLRTVAALLEEQVRRRTRGQVPGIDHDPAWVVEVAADDRRSVRAVEALLSLSDGLLGVRGSKEVRDPRETPAVRATGVYVGAGSTQHLLEAPWPLHLAGTGALPGRRRLDLRTGVLLHECEVPGHDLRSLRFVAAGRGGVLALRAEGTAARPDPATADGSWWRAGAESSGVVGVTRQRTASGPGHRTLERLVGVAADPRRPPTLSAARTVLSRAAATGFDRLLREHRAIWAARWASGGVAIPDDPHAELAARFALFHLWSLTSASVELPVGARGLTGAGYAGHVFWDADVFVLPALVTLDPPSARAMLEYRLRRLGSARAQARARGLAGARFPWESARDGEDVTPTAGRSDGGWVHILTGQMEEHVVADIAWAACRYADWCDDDRFLAGLGRPLLTETARYWASRVERDPDGTGHLRHVIGPDEYHEDVDDNAYTNVLARWNLRRGATLADDPDEGAHWCALADALVVGYDPATGRHEQFAGYDGLEPLLVADIGTPPLAADLLLGAQGVAGSQVIKQADVLMAHHLLPDELPPGSLQADLEHYLPRTAHGSSLSPAVTAALLARAGRPDEALRLLDVALVLDLDDLTGMTSAGLHVATLAGVWQALVTGFAGLRVSDGCLVVDPCLPARWPELGLRLRCLSSRIRLTIRHASVDLMTDRPLRVRTRTSPAVLVTTDLHLVKSGDGWEVMP
jgi:trehalose/maltose hydrolase-like predicted phosphorylase